MCGAAEAQVADLRLTVLDLASGSSLSPSALKEERLGQLLCAAQGRRGPASDLLIESLGGGGHFSCQIGAAREVSPCRIPAGSTQEPALGDRPKAQSYQKYNTGVEQIMRKTGREGWQTAILSGRNFILEPLERFKHSKVCILVPMCGA